MDTLPTISTERTVLRVLAPDDAGLLHAYRVANRDHLAPWEPLRDEAWYTGPSAAQHLQQALAESLAGSALHLAALDRGSGAMVASIAFTNIVRGVFLACHLGYSVAHSHQGSGLMTEVARAGIGHMFGHVGLHRIMANHMPRNTRSEALLRRLGFEREGYARAYLRINGRWEDMVLNSLINET
jgi:ribosomal-protein-alanine N-acetyltransferase